MMRIISALMGLVLASATPVVALAKAAPASTTAQLSAVMECSALAELDFTGVAGAPSSILSATLVAATDEVEEHCHVKAYVAPQVGFALNLPTRTWNGRYFQTGCGGLCGMIALDKCADAQAKGFAVSANNMGHVGHFWRDALWGAVRELREDYAGRSTYVASVASKAIITTYYGAAPAYSYFRGCSTGGREGLYLAQHHPEAFDGIIAGDPAFPGRLGALANNWDANYLLDAQHKPVFDMAKLRLLNRAVLAECDGLDGLEDGIIEDPRKCSFDPRVLQCPAGKDRADCLTKGQVTAAIALYQGPRNSAGISLSPGAAPYGSELAWDGHNRRSISDGYLKYLAFAKPRPDFSYRDFDWDLHPDEVRAQTALYDPVAPGEAPDLSAFRKAGGRLIAYHGWADPGVPPQSMLDYYGHVVAAEGGFGPVQAWFRVFMLPGMHHCRGGDAPDVFHFLPLIMDWVEKDQAPDGVIATQFAEDGVTVRRTRPLYAYPAVARYSGEGDVNDAANWQKHTPTELPDDRLDWLWAPGR